MLNKIIILTTSLLITANASAFWEEGFAGNGHHNGQGELYADSSAKGQAEFSMSFKGKGKTSASLEGKGGTLSNNSYESIDSK